MATENEQSTELNQKKAEVTSLLQKREQERLAKIQERKERAEDSAAVNENANVFFEDFRRAKLEVESMLARSSTLDKNELVDHFDSLILSVQKMQKFLSDSAMFLPSYYVGKSHETIAKLNESIKESRDQLIPKKKFAFRSKKKVAEKTKTADIDVVDNKTEQKKMNLELSEKRLTDLSNQTLSMSEADISQSDVVLSNLTECTVKLFGCPSTVHANSLSQCTVLCGPVSSSVFLDGCSNCTFVVACQQLRVHSTRNSKFYLHVTSRAIIEDSQALQFAPYNLEYDGLSLHYEKSGLDKARNAWNDVDDFNWLVKDVPSPNWTVIPEDERAKQWIV